MKGTAVLHLLWFGTLLLNFYKSMLDLSCLKNLSFCNISKVVFFILYAKAFENFCKKEMFPKIYLLPPAETLLTKL